MQIDLGSGNQVSNGTFTHPILTVRLVCELSIFPSSHSWDTCRRIDGEMGRPLLQEMFRGYIKWQLERAWPIRSWRPLERSKLPSWQGGSVQHLQDIPRMAGYEVTLSEPSIKHFADPWLFSVRPVQPKALFVFSLTFCFRMHISSWGRSSAQQYLITRKTYTMPITGSSVSRDKSFTLNSPFTNYLICIRHFDPRLSWNGTH